MVHHRYVFSLNFFIKHNNDDKHAEAEYEKALCYALTNLLLFACIIKLRL